MNGSGPGSRLLKKIDKFGAPIQFNYKKEYTLQTQLGGILTITAGLIVIVLAYIFSLELFDKTSPVTTFSKLMRNKSEILYQDYPMALLFTDAYGGFLPKVTSLFDFYGTRFDLYQNYTVPLRQDAYPNYTFYECHSTDFPPKFADAKLKSGDTPNQYCMHFDNYSSYYNDYGTMNSSFLILKVQKCVNTTRKEGNWCASQEIIDKYSKEFWVTMAFPDYFVTPENYNEPSQLYFKTFLQRVGSNFYKRNNFRIKTTQIETDQGWFQEEWHTDSFPQLENVVLDMDLKAADSNLIYAIVLESPKLGDLYIRKYIKLQAILANIGGLMNIVATFCTVACNKVSEISFYLQESKDLVNFHSDLLDNDGKEELSKYDKEEDQSKNNIIIIPLQIQVKKLPTDSEKLESKNSLKVADDFKGLNHVARKLTIEDKNILKYSSENSRKVGFCDFLRNLACNRKNEDYSKFYDALVQYFMTKLDIRSFIKLSHDFDILRSMMFGNTDKMNDLFKLKIPIEEIFFDYLDEMEREKLSEAQKGKPEDELKQITTEIETQTKLRKSLTLVRENLKSKNLFDIAH